MNSFASPIRRRRDGRYAVRLNTNLRVILASVAKQIGPMIDQGDQATTRLFPPAYVAEGSEAAERQYRTLVDGALRNHHRQVLEVLIDTSQADTLSADELNAWLSAIGIMRLTLGTRLDVSEEMVGPAPDDPAAAEHAVYDVLGVVQATIIDVLASELPDEGASERAL